MGITNFAKYVGTLKLIGRVPGVASALGRVVSSVLDRIPGPAAAALSRSLKGPQTSTLPWEAEGAPATANAARAGTQPRPAVRGTPPGQPLNVGALQRQRLAEEIAKALQAAEERSATERAASAGLR